MAACVSVIGSLYGKCGLAQKHGHNQMFLSGWYPTVVRDLSKVSHVFVECHIFDRPATLSAIHSLGGFPKFLMRREEKWNTYNVALPVKNVEWPRACFSPKIVWIKWCCILLKLRTNILLNIESESMNTNWHTCSDCTSFWHSCHALNSGFWWAMNKVTFWHSDNVKLLECTAWLLPGYTDREVPGYHAQGH